MGNHNKNSNLKLPTVRRLHFKASHIILTVILFLVGLFCLRVAIWEHNYLKRMEGSERATAPMVSINDGETVDDKKPASSEVAEYTVAADKPRHFSIPSLNIVNARIVEIGVSQNGELSTPYNIYDVGWYRKSSLPGTTGVAVLDGHSGMNELGVFGKLPKINLGDEIRIEMGNGILYTYRVTNKTIKNLANNEANDYMEEAFSPLGAGVSSLSIITCTGEYNYSKKTFNQRFFLQAELEK